MCAIEVAKIDSNAKRSLLGVTDDASAELRKLRVDSSTGRLKCTALLTLSGITKLNLLTPVYQYFSVGNSGNQFNISSSGSVHTFNLPTASASGTGQLTAADWTTFNNKLSSFSANPPLLYNGGSITITQASATGTGYLTGTDWTTFNNKMGATTFNAPLTLASGSVSLGSITSAYASGYTGTGNWVLHTAPTFAGVLTSGGSIVASQDVQFATTATFDAEYGNGNIASDGTVNWQNGNKQSGTITTATTIHFIAPPGPCNLVLRLNQDNANGGVITWPSTTKWSGGSILSTGSLKTDIATFYYDGISNYYGMLSTNFV